MMKLDNEGGRDVMGLGQRILKSERVSIEDEKEWTAGQ